MGQARARGTFEERRSAAIERDNARALAVLQEQAAQRDLHQRTLAAINEAKARIAAARAPKPAAAAAQDAP